MVDDSGNAGILSSIAVDSTGAPHVAYREKELSELRYARRADDTWSFETVAPLTPNSVSLQLDEDGVPSILYVWGNQICHAQAGDPAAMPPTPDPMTWNMFPQAAGHTAIEMTATTATDADGVEYYFEETTGNLGGSDSGWQDSPVYTDTDLSSDTEYCYRVRARDKSPYQNATGWSASCWTSTGPAAANDPPTIDWIEFLPFDNPEDYTSPWPRLEDLVLDASGNAYAAGEVPWNDPSLGWPGVTFVGKWSPSGALLWDRIYDLPDQRQHARAAAMDDEGNLFVVGIRATTGAPSWFILRIDESGTLQETWSANDGLYKCFRSIDIDPSGDLIVCANYGSSDSWVGRFAWKTSTWVWGQTYDINPATSHDFNVGTVGALDPDGDVYYFGRNITIGDSQETLIVKISAVDGTVQGLEFFDFGPGYEEFPTAFSVDSEGNLIGLVWHVEDSRGTVFKLDSELNLVWTHTIYGNLPYVFLRELDIGPDDTVYVVGRDGEAIGWYENSQNSHIFTCALSSDGELLWIDEYDAGGPEDMEWGSGDGIACFANGGRVVSGGSVSFSETDWVRSYAILSYGKTVVDSSAVFRVEASGDVHSDGAFYGSGFNTGSSDVAEWVPVTDAVEAGVVLELDPNRSGSYRLSQESCSALVAGVVSSEPGIVLGATEHTEGKALLVLIGIVPVKVTNEGGPIQPGDLLVTSSTPGHAMRWAGPEPCLCSLVGKALEPMDEEKGVILMLLTAH